MYHTSGLGVDRLQVSLHTGSGQVLLGSAGRTLGKYLPWKISTFNILVLVDRLDLLRHGAAALTLPPLAL